MLCKSNKKWKTCRHTSIIPYVQLCMRQTGLLHVAIGPNWTFKSRILWINHPIRVSRQAFPRKIDRKVRGVFETHGYCNVAYATAWLHMHSHSVYMEYWLYYKSILHKLGRTKQYLIRLIKNAKPCQTTIMAGTDWFHFSFWLICKFQNSTWLPYKVENTSLDRML